MIDKVKAAPIEVFARQTELSCRAANALCSPKANLKTVGDLLKLSPALLLGIPGIGRATLVEIERALEANGLHFCSEQEEERLFVPAERRRGE